jgi:hypothetical protein
MPHPTADATPTSRRLRAARLSLLLARVPEEFGWLGNRWRTERWAVGALIAGAALCLEPLAHITAGSAIRSSGVWASQVAVGLAMVGYVAVAARLQRTR